MKEELEEWESSLKIQILHLRENEDIFREHFGTVIPPTDNKFAALKLCCMVWWIIHLCTTR